MLKTNQKFSLLLAPKGRTIFAGVILLIISACISKNLFGQSLDTTFKWPKGEKAAVSLTFDDARLSQVDTGTALLDRYGVKATFFVVPSGVEQRLDGWKRAVASGHEIGNHTMTHPCTGNFSWSRKNALENYSLEDVRSELLECNNRIKEMLGVTPEVFAYPCGQKFVGRASNTKSYVPLVSQMFLLGRGWRDESMNDPTFCDFAQISGIEMDGKSFNEILPLIEEAKRTGQWLVFAGHEIGQGGVQTTQLTTLKQLIEYAQDPSNGIWLAPVGAVAKYVGQNRAKPIKE
jgi:peptidoglycan/xylan/chitin deacetylase (PgdA/CDA1 family)